MKIALVADFLTTYGGAERVVEAIHEIYPEAPLYTAFYNPAGLGPHKERFKNWEIHTSRGKFLPFWKRLMSPYRILAPWMFGGFDLAKYDVIISSTSTYFANTIKTKKGQVLISYCHTPPRYLYGYPTATDWKKYWWGRVAGETANFFLRMMDFDTAQKVDYFVANSKETQRRIQKFYRKDSTVIYPPVDVDGAVEPQKGEYFLVVSRLDLAKRIDLAIEACNRLKLPLKIIGQGKQEEYLKSIVGKTVEFVGEASDEEKWKAYSQAKALIFTARHEDFGIVPLEAMAAGKPVIALREGGVMESVVEGKTGEFFDKPSVDSLVNVLKNFKEGKYKTEDCQTQARKFSKENFQKEFKKFVESKSKDGLKRTS